MHVVFIGGELGRRAEGGGVEVEFMGFVGVLGCCLGAVIGFEGLKVKLFDVASFEEGDAPLKEFGGACVPAIC